MALEWNIENNEILTTQKKETLWKIIDEKKKDDPSLYVWKQTMINYLLDEKDWIWKLFRWIFCETFSTSINELKDISKEIKNCQTKDELDDLEISILNWAERPTPQQNETQASEHANNDEHYEIDHFEINISQKYRELYNQLQGPEKPDIAPFACAMKWYEENKWSLKNPKYLTIVDYTKSKNDKRFYVINMDTKKIEYATTVWHWDGSWTWDFATSFSNINGSHQSSLWFFRTPDIIESPSNRNRSWMRMNWIETNSNISAASRWIYMHPGWKISQWCFTLQENASEIMNKLKWDSLLFAYAKSKDYFTWSNYFQTQSNWNIIV